MKKKSKVERLTYVGGNCLRGFYEGQFKSIDEAWSYLSTYFLLSYPCKTGRTFYMYVQKKNEFGFEQLILCKDGITEINKLNHIGVKRKCKPSGHYYL